MKLSVPDYILAIRSYVPGKPLPELKREYGIEDAIKLASNENPLGPSPRAVAAIQSALGQLHRYPDGGGFELTHRLAEKLRVAPENIVLGNGSDEIIGMLTQVLLRPGDQALMPWPSFSMYDITARCAGATPVGVPLKAQALDLRDVQKQITPSTRMIFLNNPHNPTGTIIFRDALDDFIETLPAPIVVVLDEAYIEFVRDSRCPRSLDYLDSGKAVAGLRTFSKAYGLAGLRIGYGVMPPDLAELLHRIRMPFNANSLAQTAAMAALTDEAFLNRTLELVHTGLDFMYQALDQLGVQYWRSQANFFLIDLGRSADEVFEALLAQGVIVRSMTSYGLPDCIRVNVGLPDENRRLIESLKKVLGV
ncbi:MAG: histidinol-phosphate transaminase [Desulfobacterales bacterium]|nr:MAG: histidinol-phosphate transaminase [Desulfobacterales bacterium]